MALLAGLPGLRVAVRACEPFSIRIINNSIPEYAIVAGSAKPALFDQWQVGVFGGDIIVIKRAKEQLVPWDPPGRDAAHPRRVHRAYWGMAYCSHPGGHLLFYGKSHIGYRKYPLR